MKVVVSDAADRDLLQIHSYIAERNPRAAEALLSEVDKKFQSLSQFPFIGRGRPSLGTDIRSVVVGSYVIFYTVGPGAITIVRVLHGRRDIDAEFRR
jgi:toxin ParE1/3/4